jgi:predicted alpha/beta-hydrolase family hydrolase
LHRPPPTTFSICKKPCKIGRRASRGSIREVSVIDVDTPHGRARAHLHPVDDPRAALVLGHGAGGGIGARDLVTATEVANSEGYSVALAEQPYLVAGRRAPAPAGQLDTAFTAIVERLTGDELGGLPLIVGGRSLGARVACRTAGALGAVGVLCLAFPVHPPGRPDAPNRLPELDAVEVPVLVVQGERDPFGMPPDARDRTVARVPGDHGLKKDLDALADAVRAWLQAAAGRGTPSAS